MRTSGMAWVPARNDWRASSARSKLSERAARVMAFAAFSGMSPTRDSARASAASKSSMVCNTDASEKAAERGAVTARLSINRVDMTRFLHVEEDGFRVALEVDLHPP